MQNNPMQSNRPAIVHQQGACFNYAVPQGWRVTEDGTHAVVLVAPDNTALTIMVGVTALPAGYSPAQFIYDKLAQIFTNLRLGPPQPAPPVMGMQHAIQHGLAYVSKLGFPCCGVAKCSVAINFDGSCNFVMTSAVSREATWPDYSQWLPQLADDITPSNAGAFGRSQVVAQDRRNEWVQQQQFNEYQEWSTANWQAVTDHRGYVQDGQNFAFRENLGAVQTFMNPYDSQPVELSSQFAHHWVSRQGEIFSTNDPSVNPNVGSTKEWMPMRPVRR
jgi:hypothetical protein